MKTYEEAIQEMISDYSELLSLHGMEDLLAAAFYRGIAYQLEKKREQLEKENTQNENVPIISPRTT